MVDFVENFFAWVDKGLKEDDPVVVGLVGGLVGGLVVGLVVGLVGGLVGGLVSGLVGGLVYGLVRVILTPFIEPLVIILSILLIMEFYFWFISKAKPKAKENVYAFVVKQKIKFGLVATYLVYQAQGIVYLFWKAVNWFGLNQKFLQELWNSLIVWIGIGGLIIIIVAIFVWFNSLKYRK
jgi:hypothetical protein